MRMNSLWNQKYTGIYNVKKKKSDMEKKQVRKTSVFFFDTQKFAKRKT